MPTLNFPPVYVEDAVNASVTYYKRRVDIYEADGTTLWLRGAPLHSGSITVDMSRTERRTASLMLYNDGRIDIDRDDGFWYDKVIKIYMGVVTAQGTWETCLGTFLIDQIDRDSHENLMDLNMRDFSKKLSYPIPYPVGWPINTPIEDIITDLAVGGGISPSKIDVPITTSFIEEDRTFSSGSSRMKAAYDLATAHGYDLYFDADGVLVMEEFTDPHTSQPQYTFQVGADSNLSEIKRNISDALIFNHIAVEGETPGGVPVWGEAFNYNPTSPTRIQRLGFRTKQVKNSWVVSNTQATEVAEQILLYSSLERYEADLMSLVIPWLDVGITVNFDDPSAAPGDPTRFLMSQLEINLDLSPAKARVGRVTSVIERQAVYPDTTLYPSTDLFPSNAT